MPANQLDALRTLLQGQQPQQQGVFDPVQLRNLQDTRRRELERNIGMAQRAGDEQDVQGMGTQLKSLTGEMEADPYTGAAEQERVAGIRAADLEAIQQGFRGGDVYQSGPSKFVSGGSPTYSQPGPVPSPRQQMSLYEQQMGQQKAEQPERLAQLQGALGMQKQQSADEAAMARLQEQEKGATARTQLMYGTYGRRPTGMSAVGAGGNINPLLRDVTAALQNAQAKGLERGWSAGGGATPEKVALDSAVNNVLSRSPDIDGGSFRRLVGHITQDPQLSRLPLQDILTALGEDQLTNDEFTILNAMLYSERGF